MPHIHIDPGQHDFTASAYIVRTDTPEPTLMLHMHRKLHRYMQFGGHIELHENPWQAVIHELEEESGYAIDQLKLLQPAVRLRSLSDAELHPYPVYVQTHQFGDQDHYHIDIAFAFITDQAPQNHMKEGESEEIVLFTLDELTALTPDKIRGNVKETGMFILTDCMPGWEVVNVPVPTTRQGT